MESNNFTSDDIKILTDGLDANAKQKRQHAPMEEFAFFMRDENDKIVGGCNGWLYYGCMYLEQLWIDEMYRGQNFGTKLVQAAEDLAKSKGCSFFTMETMDWEALDFYKKLGYRVEGEVRGYDKGTIMYQLRKDL